MKEVHFLAFPHKGILLWRRNKRQSTCVDESERGNEYLWEFLSIAAFLGSSAGITSAITAPLAAAYVARGCFGWESGLKSKQFRAVWFLILSSGVVFSSLDIKPIEIIKFAQVANGILLPVVAGILLWMVNKKVVLGNYVNSKFQNILGFIILIVTIFLGLRGLDKVFEFNIF